MIGPGISEPAYNSRQLLYGRIKKIVTFDTRFHRYTHDEIEQKLDPYINHNVEVQHLNIDDGITDSYAGTLEVVKHDFMINDRNLTARLLQEGTDHVGSTILKFNCLTSFSSPNIPHVNQCFFD